MARFSVALGRKIKSSALIADAWHHRSDAIASVLVAVAIVASYYGYTKVDAIFGLLVSALILYTGWELGRGAVSVLIGLKADQETLDRVFSVAIAVPGVQGIHKITSHEYGVDQKFISLHIQVDGQFRVHESHEIAAQVKYALRDAVGVEATVHVEPSAIDDSESQSEAPKEA